MLNFATFPIALFLEVPRFQLGDRLSILRNMCPIILTDQVETCFYLCRYLTSYSLITMEEGEMDSRKLKSDKKFSPPLGVVLVGIS